MNLRIDLAIFKNPEGKKILNINDEIKLSLNGIATIEFHHCKCHFKQEKKITNRQLVIRAWQPEHQHHRPPPPASASLEKIYFQLNSYFLF